MTQMLALLQKYFKNRALRSKGKHFGNKWKAIKSPQSSSRHKEEPNRSFRTEEYINWSQCFTDGISSRSEMTDERVGVLQDNSWEKWSILNTRKIIYWEKMNRTSETRETVIQSVTFIPSESQKESRKNIIQKKNVKKMLTVNVPNLGKNINLEI